MGKYDYQIMTVLKKISDMKMKSLAHNNSIKRWIGSKIQLPVLMHGGAQWPETM